MSTAALYLVTLLLLVLSFRKDRKKTRQALVKAWKSFENILPQFLSILVLIGLMLAVLDRETITWLLGAESGADAAAMMAVEHGKGRMFLSADAMAFQPFRIELADNAALLENIVGWLLNRPVTPEMRDAFRANLAISF